MHRVRFAAAVRPLVRGAVRLLLAALARLVPAAAVRLRPAALALVLAVVLALAAAPLAFADTAPPPTAAESNTVVLGVVALGALLAILVLNRPRKPGSR